MDKFSLNLLKGKGEPNGTSRINKDVSTNQQQTDNSNRNAAGNGGLKLNFGDRSSNNPSNKNPLKDVLANRQPATSRIPSQETAQKIAKQQLQSDLADIDMSTIPAKHNTAPNQAANLANYIYEGQAEAATDRATEAFYEQLELLKSSLGTQFVHENINVILKFINEHSFLKDILKPEDVGIMVRCLRESYGLAVKASAKKKTKATARQAEVDDIVADLSDIEI